MLKATFSTNYVIGTDKLNSYSAAKKEIIKSMEHRYHKEINNWADNSHQLSKGAGAANAKIQITQTRARFLCDYEPLYLLRIDKDDTYWLPKTTAKWLIVRSLH